jgi:hypothetical protein
MKKLGSLNFFFLNYNQPNFIFCTVTMRSFSPALLVCLSFGIATCQFNNGPGNFFTFNSGPSAQAGRPQQQQPPQALFRPQQQQQQFLQAAAQPALRQPAPVAGGAGGCTPSPNYQSGNRNFWVSWRGQLKCHLFCDNNLI